jgi:hypothetical protein
MHARGIPFATLLLLALAAAPAHATTAVVPDSFPTIQAGMNSGRDTVLVRGGRYDENLTGDRGLSDNRPLTLLPYPPSGSYGEAVLPQVESLTYPGPCPPYAYCGGDLVVRGFRFRGPVRLNTSHPCDLTFETCRMDSGLSGTLDRPLNASGCTILGGLSVNAPVVNITLNSVCGGGIDVYGDGYFTIRGNYVRGPAPFGIKGRDGGGGGSSIEGNTVIATETGIMTTLPTVVTDNEVMDCSGSAFVGVGGTYERNTVARCGGYGFEMSSFTVLKRNRVLDCASGGVRALGLSVDYSNNVVGRCGGPGFDIENGPLHGNTSYLNEGAGFLVRSGGIGNPSVANNLAFGNSGPGLLWVGSETPTLACNDWFGNTGGATSGTPPGETDLAVDPFFCDLSKNDVHLSAGSPLLDASGCGLIGALGQGCLAQAGVSPPGETLVRAFTVSPNPSRGVVHFSWASADRPERVEVYDVTGARRWSSPITAGASSLQWPSTDREGTRLPAGIYYARLTSTGTATIARFVLVQ